MDPDRDSLCNHADKRIVQVVRDSTKPPYDLAVQDPARDKTVWGRLVTFPSLGVILGVLSSFSFSVAIMLVKVIKDVDPLFFVVCRGILQLFLFNAVAFYQGLSLQMIRSKTVMLYLFLTGSFGSVAQILAYASLLFIPLGDATAIILSAPVFVSLFACILLKEKCGAFQVLTVMIAVVGVLLVCRPTFIFGSIEGEEVSTTDHIIGTSMVAAGCISLAGVYVTLRKLSHLPTAITNSTLGLFSITFGLLMLVVKGNWQVPECGLESVLLVISACCGTMGMLLFVCATKVEDAGPLSVVRTSEIIFAFIWQSALLDHVPSWTTMAGAGAIVSSVVLTGMQKWNSKHLHHISSACRLCGASAKAKRRRVDKSMDLMPTRSGDSHQDTQC